MFANLNTSIDDAVRKLESLNDTVNLLKERGKQLN